MKMVLVVALVLVAQVPRDARPPAPATGTASIAGIVMIDEDLPQPLRRARVTIESAALPEGRTTITDDEGRYRIAGLPAGRYSVRATREGFVAMSYGARRTTGAGARVVLGPRETRRDVNLRLPRGAVLSGRVTDANGQPRAGLTISALERTYVPAAAQWRLVSRGRGAITDDRGEYRLFGLPPGEYTVSATVGPLEAQAFQTISDEEVQRALADVRQANTPFRSRPGFNVPPSAAVASNPEVRRAVSFATVYFPGTTLVSHAATMSVARGEERGGLDFDVEHVPNASLSGTIVMPEVGAGVPINLRLLPSDVVTTFFWREARVMSGGTFTFAGLPPAVYTLAARSLRGASPSTGLPSSVSVEVVVDGEPIEGLSLVGRPDLVIAGRLRFEGRTPVPSWPSGRVPLPLAAIAQGLGVAAALVTPDGRFTMTIPAGRYRLQPNAQGIHRPVGRWFLKSVRINGHDLLEEDIEVREGTSDAVVTFSDSVSQLTGKVIGAGRDVPDGYVVVFSTSRDAWFAGSRRVAGVKAAADGTYAVHNLPAGEYWAALTTDIEEGEWGDPAVLERLAGSARRITVPENGKKVVDWSAPIR